MGLLRFQIRTDYFKVAWVIHARSALDADGKREPAVGHRVLLTSTEEASVSGTWAILIMRGELRKIDSLMAVWEQLLREPG